MVTVSREALAAGSKSFHMASKFLAPGQRNDAAALYAFCRMVDDAADDAPSVEVATSSLSRIEDELWGRRPATTFMGFFLTMAERRQVDLLHAQHLLDGVRSDLSQVRVADDRELLRYCYRVASTVGLMMCGVLGVRDKVALPFAVDLGVAMQLSNICRDVKEDAGLGRVYVPADRLAAVGLSPEDLLEDRVDRAKLANVVRELLALADGYYESANDGLRYIPFGPRLAITVASRVYRAIGRKLRRNGADAWQGRTVVGTSGKIYEATRAMVAFASPNILGWSAPREHAPALHVALQDLPGANPGAASMTPVVSTARLESVCP
ncbi:MAG: phytoene/squalene synthase family protein [Myxococcota bacterium]